MKRVGISTAILVFILAGGLLLAYFESSPSSTVLILNCSDSVGQQGRGGETVIGGVEGLVLPGSGDPAALRSLRGPDGHQYFVYKAFLAVSAASKPYATVSVVRPRGATMFYGSPSLVGALASRVRGRGLVSSSKPQVRLQVCGPKFTGYVGGIIVEQPTSVTFAVSSPHHRTERVTISIGNR